MSERITRHDLDRIARTISEGRKITVEVSARNGHKCVDHYRGSVLVDTLFVGTAREVYTYLQGMRRYQLEARA